MLATVNGVDDSGVEDRGRGIVDRNGSNNWLHLRCGSHAGRGGVGLFLALMRRALATRTEITAASGDNDAADHRAAAAALFPFALIDAMANLEFPGPAFRVHVVRNR